MKRYLAMAIAVMIMAMGTAFVGANNAPQEAQVKPQAVETTVKAEEPIEIEQAHEIEPQAVAPSKVEKHSESKPITWWCGRCGKGYTDDTPKGECPKCKHVPVVTCECGFQYYKYDINGNKVTCPECELKAWEEAQKQKEKKVEKPTVEAPAQPEPVELTPNELYDLEIENGEYCEAREHYTDGEHDTGTGCKTEE